METRLIRLLRERGVADSELRLYDLDRLSKRARSDKEIRRVLTEDYGLRPAELKYYYLAEDGQLRAKTAAEITLMGIDAVARGQRPAAGRGTRPMPAAEYGVFGSGQNVAPVEPFDAPAEGNSGDDRGHTSERMETQWPDKPGDRDLSDEHGIMGMPDKPTSHSHGIYAEHQHSGDNDHTDAPLYDPGDEEERAEQLSEPWRFAPVGSQEFSDEVKTRAQWLAEDRYGAATKLAELEWEKAQTLYEAAERELREEAGE